MILVPQPLTRINDRFIHDDRIDASPLKQDVTNYLIDKVETLSRQQYQLDFYKNFALDIVTETVFDYPYPCITEKTLRPIACKRMFVVLGPPGILDLLKHKGFHTFGDFLDEHYDEILDPVARFHHVVASIRHFLDKPLNDIKKYYKINKQKFHHNFLVLKNLRAVEYEAIEKLFQKT